MTLTTIWYSHLGHAGGRWWCRRTRGQEWTREGRLLDIIDEYILSEGARRLGVFLQKVSGFIIKSNCNCHSALPQRAWLYLFKYYFEILRTFNYDTRTFCSWPLYILMNSGYFSCNITPYKKITWFSDQWITTGFVKFIFTLKLCCRDSFSEERKMCTVLPVYL